MEFHTGDTVMHWTYGLGQITRQEERVLIQLKNHLLCCRDSRHDYLGSGR